MKKKVIKVENLKTETNGFDVEKFLKNNSDCIFGYQGAYKRKDTKLIEVNEISDAEILIYTNMETNDTLKIPVKYQKYFEESNYIVKLKPIPIPKEIWDEKLVRIRRKKLEAKNSVKQFSSNR